MPELRSSVIHNLRVYGLDRSVVVFNIRKTTQMSRLIRCYCDHVGIHWGRVRFMFSGSPVAFDQTPLEVS